MPNLYLIQKTNNEPNEVSADFYERQGDDWVFMLGGAEVARLAIESIVSIAKAPRDFGLIREGFGHRHIGHHGM